MMVIRRENQTICTRWNAKPMAFGKILNYKSFHPLNMKINTMHNFIKRVDQLSTEYSQQQKHRIIFAYLHKNDCDVYFFFDLNTLCVKRV